MENDQALNIIIVDDDPDDHFLTRKAIKSIDVHHTIEHVYSGSQLMDMLFDGNVPRKVPQLPDIIFLDLNMPNVDGYRVLSVMNNSKSFESVAVYILSSSPYEKDILKWRELGVTDFFVKPYEFARLKQIFEEVLSRHAKAVPNALKV